jgi:hypothetical protein
VNNSLCTIWIIIKVKILQNSTIAAFFSAPKRGPDHIQMLLSARPCKGFGLAQDGGRTDFYDNLGANI